MAIGNIRKLNVRSPYFVEVVDEYLGVVTPPPPDPEPNGTDGFYYELTRCSDLSIFYSISYPAEPFSSSERVEDSSGVSYVVSGSQEEEPAGVKKTITTTGLIGCPEVEIPDPTTTSDSLECSGIMYFGAWVGIRRFVLDTTNKQFGDYTFSIANAKVPVKFTSYIEGDTPPAYDTIGLDTYANQWLAETGDDASLLSSETANPDGVTRNFTFTTSAADVGKNIIVEVFAPMATENDMSITSTSCQPLTNAQLPSTTDFVTVVTVAVRSVYNIFVNGATVPPSDINIKLNGTNYPLPNVSANSGVRLICHDATPNYNVLTNNFPYSKVNGGFPIHQRKWSYSTSGDNFAPTLVPQELVSGAVTSGINELVITTAAGIGCNVDVRIANHAVSNHPITPNQRVINHRGDNSYTKISMTGKSLNMGNSTLASEEVFTVKFSNVNQKDVIINEATYRHEVVLNVGDSVDQIDDLISPINQLPIYYIE